MPPSYGGGIQLGLRGQVALGYGARVQLARRRYANRTASEVGGWANAEECSAVNPATTYLTVRRGLGVRSAEEEPGFPIPDK